MSFEERLINEVKQHDILYNLSSPGYKNLLAKDSVWRGISWRLGVSEEYAKKKWKNLRDTYRKNKYRQDILSTLETPGRIHEWKFFNHMRFLEDFACTRNTRGNPDGVMTISSPKISESPFEEVLFTEYSMPPHSQKSSRHEDVQKKFHQLLEDAARQLEEVSNSTSSTRQLFEALATRVENAGLTDDETGIVELAVTECVIHNIKAIKNMRPR